MAKNRLIEGAILAGGKSRRMGEDKACLKWREELLVEKIISLIKPVFSEVMLISSHKEHKKLRGVRIYPDLEKSNGPLGGILTALHYSKAPFIFCCACDMPFMNHDVIKMLIEERFDWDVVVPEFGGKTHTLFAVYSKSCIDIIRSEISSSQFKISSFYEKVKVKRLGESFFKKTDPEGLSFVNINTPADFAHAKRFTIR